MSVYIGVYVYVFTLCIVCLLFLIVYSFTHVHNDISHFHPLISIPYSSPSPTRTPFSQGIYYTPPPLSFLLFVCDPRTKILAQAGVYLVE